MNGPYRLFWGDSHHQSYIPEQDPPLGDVLALAARYLDFYNSAYYMKQFRFVRPQAGQSRGLETAGRGHLHEQAAGREIAYRGVHLEGPKPAGMLAQQWAEVQAATAAAHQPGRFVTFPGYEWQGNGRWGDHNVIYRREGFDLCTAQTLPEMYAYLRKLEVEALAIPHHTAYLTGQRAPNWAYCDETLSPYAEIFSIHGCSESDEEWIGLRHNPHMGPGVGGSTYQDALDAGLHLGAICSTDNWTMMPGHWGQGLMACLAEELTRDSLWEAFRSRRVYGVTGDRIELDFTCNGAMMGSILPATPERHFEIAVTGCDAIDRIELLRNGRVLATHSASNLPESSELPGRLEGALPTRWKVRVEMGWGSHSHELPAPSPEMQRWDGVLSVQGGKMLGWAPCWVTPGQPMPHLAGDRAEFALVASQAAADRIVCNGLVFEFEADADAMLELRAGPRATPCVLRCTVHELAQRSRLLWDEAGCAAYLHEATGLTAEEAGQTDAYYHFAHKMKVHRAMPEAAYTARFSFTDRVASGGLPPHEDHYRVRVEQRNGQRAWSSPIWVKSS